MDSKEEAEGEAGAEITHLATVITQSTGMLSQLLAKHGLRMPSFDKNSNDSISDTITPELSEIARAKNMAINACMELLDLLQGPLTCMLPLYNGSALQAISRYKIYSHVPLSGSISYESLSAKCGIHIFELKQIIRFAIVFHRLFLEKEKGVVEHSAGSRILAENRIVQAGIGQFDEFYGSFARCVDAIDQFDGHEPNETGFSLSHDTSSNLFSYLYVHPERAKQFSEAMKFYTGPIPAYSPDFLINGYPWEDLPQGCVIVDVGGSDGHIGRLIAKKNPGLKVVVQDLPNVVEEAIAMAEAGAGVGADETARIHYHAHDFFTPQSITANIYLFRWVLHDWPDEYVVQILRQLLPVMRSGARVIVNESLCPESGSLPINVERYTRYMDMMMLAINKSRLRDEDEWRGLFAQVDGGFEVRCWTPEGAALAIIEATWRE
ncbi:hypothetical protein BDV06DRAFT_228393 [Aspergillus oleicola]